MSTNHASKNSRLKKKNSQDYARVNDRFHVQGHFLPIFVPCPLKIRSPQYARGAYEERVISQLLADADPSPKTESDMSRLVCFDVPRQRFSTFVELSLWPEFICVFSEYGTIVISMPEVGYANGTFWDVHAFVPVFFDRSVRYR